VNVIVYIETADLTNKHSVSNGWAAILLALRIESYSSEVHYEGNFVPEAQQNKGSCSDHVWFQYTSDGKMQLRTAIKPRIFLSGKSRKADTGISS